jgi:hypothetical protein
MNLFKYLKHRKEILQAMERMGLYRDGQFVVVGGLDLGFRGLMKVWLTEEEDIAKAMRQGDREKEVALRMEARGRRGLRPRVETLPLEGANTFFDEGITEILDVALGYSTQQQNHYFLIGINDVTPATGWTLGTSGTKIRSTFGELTAYDESVRQTWTFVAAASKSITNSASPATITANASGTARGACLVSKSPKDGSSDNSGYAIAGKRFSADIPVADDTQINIIHTLSGSAS